MSNVIVAGLNGIDLTIIALVLLLSIKGILNGFINELFNFVGIIGGIFVASRVSNPVATFIDKNIIHLQNISLLKLAAFLLIFATIWLASNSISKLLHRKNSKPNAISMIFAFLISSLKYIFIFALIVSSLSRSSIVKGKMTKTISTSKLYMTLDKIGSNLINISDIKNK